MSILEIISHQEPEPTKLVRIKDGPQPTWCMSCGAEGQILFWSGKVMTCIPCSKGANIARKVGINIYQPGMSYKEFRAKLDDQINAEEK